MSSIVKIEAPELATIEPSRAEQIRKVFAPMADMVAGFEEKFQEIVAAAEAQPITKELCGRARRCRLDMVKVRGLTETARKAQKDEFLRAGKAIDGVSNILKWAVQEKEERLEKIEKYYEQQEAAARKALNDERVEALILYMPDAAGRTDLADMADDVWKAYFESKKKDRLDRIAAEKKAAEEREAQAKAEAEERERIRAENARLKAEAEEREKAAREEAARHAEEKRKMEEQAKREREAAEAAARKEREEIQARADAERRERDAQAAKERAEQDRILREEKAKREAAEREAAQVKAKAESDEKARKEAERKAVEEAERKEQEALAMGDKGKIVLLIDDLRSIKERYQFKSKRNRAMFADVCEGLDGIITIIKGE